MQRKLTTILCADVFGYSRLIGENEEATLRTLTSYRKLIDGLIQQHRGDSLTLLAIACWPSSRAS